MVGYPSFVAQADGEYVHNTYTAGGGAIRYDAIGCIVSSDIEGMTLVC